MSSPQPCCGLRGEERFGKTLDPPGTVGSGRPAPWPPRLPLRGFSWGAVANQRQRLLRSHRPSRRRGHAAGDDNGWGLLDSHRERAGLRLWCCCQLWRPGRPSLERPHRRYRSESRRSGLLADRQGRRRLLVRQCSVLWKHGCIAASLAGRRGCAGPRSARRTSRSARSSWTHGRDPVQPEPRVYRVLPAHRDRRGLRVSLGPRASVDLRAPPAPRAPRVHQVLSALRARRVRRGHKGRTVPKDRRA